MFFLFLLALVALFFYLFTKDKPAPVWFVPEHFGWSLIVAILGYQVFSYDVNVGIGQGLFGCALIAAILLSYEKKQLTTSVALIALTGVIAGILLGVRGNGFVQSVNGTVLSVSCLTLIMLRIPVTVRWQILWLCRLALNALFLWLKQIPALLMFARHARSNHHPRLFTALKAVILSLFIFIFFATLLTQADPIFADVMREFLEQLTGRTVSSLFIAIGLTILLAVRWKPAQDDRVRLTFLGNTEVLVPVLVLVALFAVFLAIQAQYLFGFTHADFQAHNITYSDYVRKGFVELLAATFFAGIVSYIVVLRQQADDEGKRTLSLQAVNVVLIVELALLLLSALKRDWMYVETYGLTRVRIIGGIFLGCLAAMIALLLLFNVLRRFREHHVLGGLGIVGMVAVLLLSIFNVDEQIVNATPPRNGERDHFYISALSSDAVDGWAQTIYWARGVYDRYRFAPSLTQSQENQLADAKLALRLLGAERDRLDIIYTERGKWQEFVWSEFRAYRFMQQSRALFYDTVDCLEREIVDLQVARNIELYDEEQKRLYEYEYPFIVLNTDFYYPWSVESYKSTIFADYRYDEDYPADDFGDGRPDSCSGSVSDRS